MYCCRTYLYIYQILTWESRVNDSLITEDSSRQEEYTPAFRPAWLQVHNVIYLY